MDLVFNYLKMLVLDFIMIVMIFLNFDEIIIGILILGFNFN